MNTKPLFRCLAGMAALLFALTTTAAAQDVERTFDTDAGDLLDLRLETGGDITIRGWSRSQVSVKAYFKGRDAEDLDVAFRESGRGLSIRTEYEGSRRRNYNASVDLEIMVPSRYDVDLETMGGDVTIDGVEGTFEGRTMGGELYLTGLKGRAELTTMGGSVLVENSELDGKVSTMGGEVRVEDVTGNLDASTMGGQVRYSNFNRAPGSRSASDEVRIKTMGGDINVDDAPAGVDAHTMGGAIDIGNAARYVKAHTMGGEITVDEIDGWIEATTMGGDIEVKMVGDPDSGDRHVELSSMGGDIELTVPAGLSMDFDIELTYTRRARERYRIMSDFTVDVEEDQDWDYDDGEARRTIYGTGSVNGGRNLIKIRTINGNIIIKRDR